MEVERSITSGEVVKTLASLFAHRQRRTCLHSLGQRGREFIAEAVKLA